MAWCCVLFPQNVLSQDVTEISERLLKEVLPRADRFAVVDRDIPVAEGYRFGGETGEDLVGYVFVTSDVPPEPFGYSGPVQALVGMDLEGSLTGVRVLDYWESIQESMGDFLRTPGFQEHFSGKHIGDAFRVYGDVQGISRATISVRALSRGVRDSARRVALLYLDDDEGTTPGPVEDLESLPWFDMLQRGVIESALLTDETGTAEIYLVYAESDEFGEFLVGEERFERARTRMDRREEAGHLMIYGVEGPRLRLFVREGWAIVQDGDTFPVSPREIASLGLDGGGAMEERVVLTGSMIIDGSVDVTKAFTIVYDRGPEVELISVEYLTQSAQLVELEIEGSESIPVAEEEIATAIEVEEISVGSDILEVESSIATEFVQEDDTTGANSSIEIADRNPVTVVQTENLLLEFNELQEETFLERILLETSWGRVGKLTGLFSLVLIAFFVKKSWVRIFTLGLTLLYLGFADGGFLSVSHITSGIWVGPSFYLSDLPLLMLVVFTLITTFLWGRVFCGFLCPFGVLQDLLERVVPKRLRPSIPTKIHKSGLKLKYVFLAIILVSAVSGSKVSLYQYFEPFGTVFFRSSSVTLWAIALFFLGISLVVPRFYCRYACPLGAALALTSLLSLKRIKRVEQCKSCHVCEQSCPTGAIEGPEIDFKECVRCNICEIKLIEKSGVCRHDIEDVRGRLVPLSGKAT